MFTNWCGNKWDWYHFNNIINDCWINYLWLVTHKFVTCKVNNPYTVTLYHDIHGVIRNVVMWMWVQKSLPCQNSINIFYFFLKLINIFYLMAKANNNQFNHHIHWNLQLLTFRACFFICTDVFHFRV